MNRSRSKIIMVVAVSLVLFSLISENLWAQSKVIGVILMARANSSTRRAEESFIRQCNDIRLENHCGGWRDGL